MLSNDQVLELCKPEAIKANKALAEFSNNLSGTQGVPPAHAYGLSCALVFQNGITLLAVEQFRPGSPEGWAFVEKMYGEALRDAKDRLAKQDLKTHFEKGQ